MEQSEEEAKRAVEGYHREGKRNRERGEEPQHNKRQRYDHDRRDGGRYGGRRDSGKYGVFVLYEFSYSNLLVPFSSKRQNITILSDSFPAYFSKFYLF